MATTVTIARDGYGQVEPNHLSAPKNGQIYAQLPAASTITQLENGMFVKYDYLNQECNFTGDGEWMLVFNEEKLYDERHQMHKYFVMKASEALDGKIYPRCYRISAGDIFTTNMVVEATYEEGDKLAVNGSGVLAKNASGKFKVVKATTLPDGQKAVKIQVIG